LWVDPDVPAGIRQECGRPVGAGGGGAACERDDECLTGRCLDSGCFGACLAQDDCGPVQDCQEVFVVVDDRGTPEPVDDLTTLARSCVDDPGSGAACTRDADCPERDEVCVPDLEPGAAEAGLTCARTAGGGGPGAECEGGEECATRICLNGLFCFGACAGEGDCPPAAPICGETRLILDGEPGPELQLCQPEPTACARDADCPAEGVCTFAPDSAAPGEIQLVCQGAIGDRGPGAACAGDRECRSGICLEESGRCWGACAADADCLEGSSCYYPFLWVNSAEEGQAPMWDAIPGCGADRGSWRDCARNAECPGGEWCQPVPNRWRRAWQGRCASVQPNRVGQPGLPCTDNAECASNLCLGRFPNSACFGLCRDDNDCALDRRCRSDDWVVDDANTPDDPDDDVSAPLDFCFL